MFMPVHDLLLTRRVFRHRHWRHRAICRSSHLRSDRIGLRTLWTTIQPQSVELLWKTCVLYVTNEPVLFRLNESFAVSRNISKSSFPTCTTISGRSVVYRSCNRHWLCNRFDNRLYKIWKKATSRMTNCVLYIETHFNYRRLAHETIHKYRERLNEHAS